MKKILLLLLSLSLVTLGFTQTPAPLEHYKFYYGSLTGENGTQGSGVYSSIADVKSENASAVSLSGSQTFNLGKPAINTSSGLTFSFWINPSSSNSGSRVLFGQRSVCTWDNMFAVNVNGTAKTISLELRTVGQKVSSLATSYEPNVWQRITFTVDRSTNEIKVYKNGELKSTGTLVSGSLATTFTASANLEVANSACAGNRYVGGLDELKIYNDVLSLNDIVTDYNTQKPNELDVEGNCLLAHYKFDSSLVDEKNLNPIGTADRNNVEGQAFYLSGSNTADLGNPTIGTANGLTFSFWMKPNGAMTGSRIIFGKRAVCNWDNMFGVRINGDSKQVIVEFRSTAQKATTLLLDYTVGTWQKVTFTVDQNENKVYGFKDGVVKDSVNITASSIPVTFTNNASLRIANDACIGTGLSRYIGGLDELFIYESTLSKTQVANAFSTDNDQQYSPLVRETFNNLSSLFADDMTLEERMEPITSDIDTALSLSGTESYNLGDPEIFTTADKGYTFSFWVRPDASLTGNGIIFGKRNVCTWTNMFGFNYNTVTSTINSEFRTANQKVAGLAVEYTVDEWQQIVYTVNLQDKKIRGYTNGVLTDSVVIVGNEIALNYASANILVANSPCAMDKFKGGLDEIKVYNKPLTHTEVLERYENPVITGLFNQEERVGLNIYPNPTSSIIYTEIGLLKIVNSVGELVLSTNSNGQVNVAGLESGVYIVSQNSKQTKLIIE